MTCFNHTIALWTEISVWYLRYGRSPSSTCYRTHFDLCCVVPCGSSCFTCLLLLSFKLASFLQPGCVSDVWQHSAQATPDSRKQDCGSLWHPPGTSPQGPEEEAGCQDRFCRLSPLGSGGRMARKPFCSEPFFHDNGTALRKIFWCTLMSLQPPKRGIWGWLGFPKGNTMIQGVVAS